MKLLETEISHIAKVTAEVVERIVAVAFYRSIKGCVASLLTEVVTQPIMDNLTIRKTQITISTVAIAIAAAITIDSIVSVLMLFLVVVFVFVFVGVIRFVFVFFVLVGASRFVFVLEFFVFVGFSRFVFVFVFKQRLIVDVKKIIPWHNEA